VCRRKKLPNGSLICSLNPKKTNPVTIKSRWIICFSICNVVSFRLSHFFPLYLISSHLCWIILGGYVGWVYPQGHKASTIAWCYLLGADINEIRYTAGEHLKVKLLTHTAQQTLDASKAPGLTVTTRQRQARPYPPGTVQINGYLWQQNHR